MPEPPHVGLIQQLGVYVLIATILFVLIANVLIDKIDRLSTEHRSKLLIFCSVFVNLTFLGFFKYFNFFVDSASVALQAIGIDPTKLQLHIVLPVGISFYTFQSLSYTIDVYRRRAKPTANFWDFALFVAYFPPMVAGPIERARHLLPQLLQQRHIRLAQSIARPCANPARPIQEGRDSRRTGTLVDAIYNASGRSASQVDVAVATFFFAIQIFCDFSGYTDIARGVSKLLGIDLFLNFNLPYFSQNPSEFWHRWHISLSSWLRDYLYIPLGGNRRGRVRTYINLFLTMLLGGLWHGAAWNYVLWGAYQGIMLCIHRLATEGRNSLPSEIDVRVAACSTGSQRKATEFALISAVHGSPNWWLFRAHVLRMAFVPCTLTRSSGGI